MCTQYCDEIKMEEWEKATRNAGGKVWTNIKAHFLQSN
jgi:hypothetical protein